jgi:hypothetical protein
MASGSWMLSEVFVPKMGMWVVGMRAQDGCFAQKLWQPPEAERA